MRSWGFRRLGLCPTSCVEPSYVQSLRRMLRRWFIVQLQKRYVNYETHFPAWGWADNASVHPFKRSGASFYQKCFLKHLLWNRFLWVWILLHTQVSSDGSSDGSYVTAACALRLSRASCYPVESVSLCFFIVLSVSSFPLQLNFITLNISSVSSSTLTCAGVSAAGTLNTISIQVVLIYPSVSPLQWNSDAHNKAELVCKFRLTNAYREALLFLLLFFIPHLSPPSPAFTFLLLLRRIQTDSDRRWWTVARNSMPFLCSEALRKLFLQ